jgi:hypothetical protein
MPSLIDFQHLAINSPKRSRAGAAGWHGFFPYYAGFPTSFAHDLIVSAGLPEGAVVLDPWNGSGTTTFAASRLGYDALGVDLNPVMVMVARARLLPPSEAGSIRPLARDVAAKARIWPDDLAQHDPLLLWFAPPSARLVRAVEAGIRALLVDGPADSPLSEDLSGVTGMAATLYVALFSVARDLAAPLRSSNPTWTRKPKAAGDRITVTEADLLGRFVSKCGEMAEALSLEASSLSLFERGSGNVSLRAANTTTDRPFSQKADLIVTSPPYCTRIDYAASTRVELAVLAPVTTVEDLGRAMIGSTRVPASQVRKSAAFGITCLDFLERLRAHPSKASSGYYYKTHVDYFRKMVSSLRNLASSLSSDGGAVIVVQDSHYKEIHNDLPAIIIEMAAGCGLHLRRRENFALGQTLAGVNPKARKYRKSSTATEAVLCFSTG